MNEERAPGGPISMPAAAVAALMSGNTIEAIKIVRQEQRVGLKEAKDQVDAYVAQHPEIGMVMSNTPDTLIRRPLLGIVLVAIVGWLAWRFLSGH